MDFTRLRLVGFKSFVDPTEILISKGLTGIVGPNGCGKSNITEALRWVMGETSARSLRGGGMEDVIFSGTHQRPARSFAEVTLHIDNSDRTAPTSFNTSDELDIVRRITKNTGSIYKVNGKNHRARDVQILFADAATGANSPSLVRQGQIGELINAKPKNRRRILEDAAGIAGLYSRRHEAELRLKATQDNLNRLDDILQRMQQQLATLERQSKQVQRYRNISQDLRTHENLLLYTQWFHAKHNLSELTISLHHTNALYRNASTTINEIECARTEIEKSLPALYEEEAIAVGLRQKVTTEQNTVNVQIRQAEQTTQILQAQLKQDSHDLAREENLNIDTKRMLEQLVVEDADITAQQQNETTELQQAKAITDKYLERVQQLEKEIDTENLQFARQQAEYEARARDLEEQHIALRRTQEEREKVETALTELTTVLQRLEVEHHQAQSLLSQAAQQAHFFNAQVTQTEIIQSSAQKDERTAHYRATELETQIRSLVTEKKTLLNLLVQTSKSTHSRAVLTEIEVEQGYEKSLGAVLGNSLDYPVNADDISICTTGWRDTKTNEHINACDNTPLPFQTLKRYVHAPSALRDTLEHVYIIENLPTPAQWKNLQPGQSLVNKAGDVWRWDGLHLNSQETASRTTTHLEYKNQLRSISVQLDELGVLLEEQQIVQKETREMLNNANTAYQTARTQRKQADDKLAQQTRLLSSIETDLDIKKSRYETLEDAFSKYTKELDTLVIVQQQAQDYFDNTPDIAHEKERIIQMRKLLLTARQELDGARQSSQSFERRVHARKKRQAAIQNEKNIWTNRQRNTVQHLKELQKRIDKTERDLCFSEEKSSELEKLTDSLSEQHYLADTRHQNAVEELEYVKKKCEKIRAEHTNAQNVHTKIREERIVVQTKIEVAQQKLSDTLLRLTSRTGKTPDTLSDTLDLPEKCTINDLQQCEILEKKISDLQLARERLGTVNLCADEELLTVKEEYNSLLKENKDLEEAIKKLHQGISRLNNEGRQRLLDAFEEVNRNFSLLFKHLFNGGEARLTLVESDDPLESGLEILCMPPGKKLSSLSLLSGGEQTLTALSLIFAVFLVKPSPVCVLDEVDAPLDDANVNRFCNLLEEMTQRTRTRFLIVTHHATTMSRMDRLFGVTMQEQGVSQLVSVNLSTATEMVS